MTTVPDTLVDLDVALAGLIDALIGGQPAAVLAAEQAIAEASGRLSATSWTSDMDAARARATIRHIQVTIEQATHLGRASAGLLEVLIPQLAYGGARQATAAAVSSETRT